ncbi:2-keto-4-pentenoate hydratase [Terrarubrum flagellatum]|uniref:2-keto-4-pentenoate hydratase n=1 Tax=Terrirubrum flagellatum TaxID=2895980 RepID=UPI0031453914
MQAERAAEQIWRAHRNRERFANLSGDLAPASVDEAYDVQEAFHRLAQPSLGPIGGLKIATTTKVMQALMGIDHPCGGAIFQSRIYSSPATIDRAPYVNLRLECEIAVKLARDLPPREVSIEEAMAAVGGIAPAFELIEDRHADYRDTKATSLIADNAWNGGVVHGAWRPFDPARGAGDVEGVLTFNGKKQGHGRPDDPFSALAWVANLAAKRGRPMKAGMIIITGSLIPTFDPPPGVDIVFAIEGLGEARARVG